MISGIKCSAEVQKYKCRLRSLSDAIRRLVETFSSAALWLCSSLWIESFKQVILFLLLLCLDFSCVKTLSELNRIIFRGQALSSQTLT